jgi:DNA adenine methylase
MNDFVLKNEKTTRPLLKWAGGKRWFAQKYSSFFEEFKKLRFVEPFAGGLGLSFIVQPNVVVANDINPHLINFYHQVKNQRFFLPDDLVLSKNYYESIRIEFNQLIALDDVQSLRAAQLFWILNRLGFNGLCRFNQQGFFNTPYGYYQKVYTLFEWQEYARLFKQWDFTCSSFEKMVLTQNDFLFCDPPYDGGWQSYSKEAFTFEEHEKLVLWITKQQNPALIMNHPTPRILSLYKNAGFELSFIMVPRTLNSNILGRQRTQEVIASYNFSWKDLIKKI